MLKKTLTYEDWDENPVTEDFYFNISMDEAEELQDMQEEWSNLLEEVQSSEGDTLSRENMKKLLAFTRKLIDISYGVRVDSKHFDKDPSHLRLLKMTPAYSALTLDIFHTEESALDFIMGVFPKKLVELAKADMSQEKLPFDELSSQPSSHNSATALIPEEMRVQNVPSVEELRAKLRELEEKGE